MKGEAVRLFLLGVCITGIGWTVHTVREIDGKLAGLSERMARIETAVALKNVVVYENK